MRAGREPERLVLDPDTLGGFGTLRVPLHLWRALSRFAAWIEPALLTEWQLLMEDYAARQDRSLVPGVLAQALQSSARLLYARADAIQAWWQTGYVASGPVLVERFHVEAQSSLPVSAEASADVAAVFGGMRAKRGVIHGDTGIAEWDG